MDGLNVYHSLRQGIEDGGGSLKWLDLHALCQSYVASGLFGPTATLERVVYFSAFATFLTPSNPGVVARHRTYVSALEASGVELVIGRFKWKPRWCPICRKQTPGHEEKETDVSIAARLLEICFTGAAETVVLVAGDTDLLPAIRTARRLAPEIQLWVAFPYKRFNQELREACNGHFRIRRHAYARHQLPNPVVGRNGRQIAKPTPW